ncbi:MAG TPA: PRC-barrel domain-containing protein [Verrucomicrobiae bacterium]|jgi:sporulation protein YlmC with PRC-barrel domain|nr:PRC-barrel domain-containing protein [Verrucomicrobiae bacterium]
MTMSKRPLSVKILFALPLAVTLAWALLGAAQTYPFSTPLNAGKLFGMKAENSDGQKIGTVRNLIIDTRSGELKYAVIGSGGFFGVRSTLKLAPAQIMSAGTAKRDTVAVFVTGEQWRLAPVFKASSLVSLGDPVSAREIARYFGLSSGKSTNNSRYHLSTTGRDLEQRTSAPAVLKFASDLIGQRVVNQKQEKIGEVIDLLVSFGPPRPAFAIISTGRFLRHDHEYAVPLEALHPTDSSRKWMLNADATTLQNAPIFDDRAWESRSTNGGAQIYWYSKSED